MVSVGDLDGYPAAKKVGRCGGDAHDQRGVRMEARAEDEEHTFGDVEVEEVGVEQRLQRAGGNSDGVNVAVQVVSVYPVADVERSVPARIVHRRTAC
jgi:hypothetical protein